MKLRPAKVDAGRKRTLSEGLKINMIHFRARLNTYRLNPNFPRINLLPSIDALFVRKLYFCLKRASN